MSSARASLTTAPVTTSYCWMHVGELPSMNHSRPGVAEGRRWLEVLRASAHEGVVSGSAHTGMKDMTSAPVAGSRVTRRWLNSPSAPSSTT
jgi:hypothetical protein